MLKYSAGLTGKVKPQPEEILVVNSGSGSIYRPVLEHCSCILSWGASPPDPPWLALLGPSYEHPLDPRGSLRSGPRMLRYKFLCIVLANSFVRCGIVGSLAYMLVRWLPRWLAQRWRGDNESTRKWVHFVGGDADLKHVHIHFERDGVKA